MIEEKDINFDDEFNDDERFLESEKSEYDIIENILRPQSMDGYVGQDKVKDNLTIFMKAAKMRKEPLDHVLLFGPPGLGKTTLAHIIASEMGSQIKVTSGPSIEKTGDLAAILTNLQEGDILFIDEIHRLNHNIEEILYPAMEDFSLDFIIGKGPSARSVQIPLKKFTLVGATTKSGSISAPLRDRFGIHFHLELYTKEELAEIARRSAEKLGVKIDNEGSLELGKRSRGTPRIVNRLLRRVRDFSLVLGHEEITLEDTKKALSMLDIDDLGLDKIDRNLLRSIAEKFNCGPVGLDTLAAMINEDKDTIEDVYEPYLIQLGFITRTPRGRIVTNNALKHLGIKHKKGTDGGYYQPSLFDDDED